MTVQNRPRAQHPIPDLGFAVEGAEALRFSAVPAVTFRLKITRAGGGPVRSVNLTTAIRIAVARRRYDRAAQQAMAELFGAPERWGSTVQPLAWTQTTTVVPPFADSTVIDLVVPCSCDTELAVTKYFWAVRDGDVPLDFLFSGTVFFQGADGRLRTAQISWASDTTYRLPAGLWHGLVDRYFAGSPWLRLSRDTYDRLNSYRVRHLLGSWDESVGALLDRAPDRPPNQTEDQAPGRTEDRTPDAAGAPWTP